MALKFKFNKTPVRVRDANKANKLGQRLRFISAKSLKSQLKAKATPAKPREEHGSGGKVKIRMEVNRVGTRTGMHMRENPPSSESMKKLRAMRRMYNKQMPVLQCSGCAFSQQCPQYKAGYQCAYLPFLNSHNIRTADDLLDEMQNMATTAVRRAHLQTIMETLTGGMPSSEVSESHAMAFSQLKMLHEAMQEQNKTSLEIESEDGSLIGKLFGDISSLVADTAHQRANVVNVVPPVTVDVPTIVDRQDASEVVQELVRDHTKEELAPLARLKALVPVNQKSKSTDIMMGEIKK